MPVETKTVLPEIQRLKIPMSAQVHLNHAVNLLMEVEQTYENVTAQNASNKAVRRAAALEECRRVITNLRDLAIRADSDDDREAMKDNFERVQDAQQPDREMSDIDRLAELEAKGPPYTPEEDRRMQELIDKVYGAPPPTNPRKGKK